MTSAMKKIYPFCPAGLKNSEDRRLGSLRQIRGHEPTRLLPVVILTTSSQQQDVIRAINSAPGYVCKPVDFNDFEKVISVGLYWLIWNEPPPVGK